MTPEQILEGQRRAGLIPQPPKAAVGDKAEPDGASEREPTDFLRYKLNVIGG